MTATKYQHTLVYRIEGVTLGAQEEAEVISDPAKGFRAVLTTDPDPHCFEADRSAAVSIVMLNTVFGQPGSGTFDERLTSELEEIKGTRERKFGKGPYLVLMQEGKVEASPPPHIRETEGFVIWLDGVAKEPLRAASKTQILAALTAVAIATEDVSGIDKVRDAVVFFRTDGKPIYSYTVHATANPSVLRAIPAEAIESVCGWYQSIACDQELERVHRLLVSSLQAEGDMLRSFLAAWTAMEILINKTFKSTYEEQFFQELYEGDYPAARRRYLERIRKVMKGKYSPVDKFALIASELSPENADEDVRQLSQAKKARDNLSHGEDIDEASLPVRTIQQLARRYLRLHLVNNS